jgi:hypothetical protein
VTLQGRGPNARLTYGFKAQVTGRRRRAARPHFHVREASPEGIGRLTSIVLDRGRPGRSGGRQPRGRFCFTLTVTDIAAGWTENRTVAEKRQAGVLRARPTWSPTCRSRSAA